MHDNVAGRVLRMARIRKGLREQDVADEAKLSRSTISRIEAGKLASLHLHTIRSHAAALGLRADIGLVGRGGEVVHLLDDEHAAIVEHLAGFLRRAGWLVEAEASFSMSGDRGRIDLLGFHQATRSLVVAEVKSDLVDLQQLLGSLNVRLRLARSIARARGWYPAAISALLAVAGTSLNRERVGKHPSLFVGFEIDAVAIRRWLRAPAGDHRWLLWIPPGAAGRTRWIAGRQRVGRSRGQR